MGMFDEVKLEKPIKCPGCGIETSEFQTKDLDCCLEQVDFRRVENFYHLCQNCKCWIEFQFKTKPPELRTIEDYEMTFSLKESAQ